MEALESKIISDCSKLNATTSLNDAYQQAVSAAIPEVAALLRTPKQMRSKCSKRKRKLMPLVPVQLQNIEITEEFRLLSYPGLDPQQPPTQVLFFQQKLVVVGDNNRVEIILIFATDAFLKALFSSMKTYADGTFFIAPQRFTQVFTMHAMYGGRSFPCLDAQVSSILQRSFQFYVEQSSPTSPW